MQTVLAEYGYTIDSSEYTRILDTRWGTSVPPQWGRTCYPGLMGSFQLTADQERNYRERLTAFRAIVGDTPVVFHDPFTVLIQFCDVAVASTLFDDGPLKHVHFYYVDRMKTRSVTVDARYLFDELAKIVSAHTTVLK